MKVYLNCSRDNPWFSTALSDLIHERDAAWAKARQTNLNPDWLYFKQLRNKCTVMIRKAKSEYFLDKTKKSTNASKFWKNIKFLTGTRSVSAIPNCITKDGIKIVDKLQMLNCFNSHFTESGSLFQTNNYTTVNSEFLNADWHLFNLSLTTKEIPQIWKSAFVVPLLKGGVPTLLDNYRPISKLCILSKLLESFISKQLTQYLHSHKLLINQSGFRKKHSTITAVLKVLNDLVRSLDGKHHCACLFIDLTKAFDTVNHNILLDRLRSVGLSDNVVLWFNTYLKGRTQCVQVEGIKSDLLGVGTGVPQGSVLGPLLYIYKLFRR